MQASTRINKYPKLMIAIHWLTLILILSAVALVFLRDAIEGKAPRLWLLNLHRSIGLLIPLVLLFRLSILFYFRKAVPVHDLPLPVKLASKINHAAIYLVLAVQPFLGWAQTSASGKDASFFGIIPLPAIVSEDMDFAETLADWHEWAAYALLFLVLSHAVAALWHHYVKKDHVLTAMLWPSKA